MTVTHSLDTLEARAGTPDERVFGEIHGRTDVSVSFAPGYYEQASDAALEEQFTRLARVLFAQRMKAYFRIRSEDFGETVTRESPPSSERDQRFVEERSRITATGTSPDGRITCSVVGMAHWTIRIQPGTHRELSEDAFCRSFAAAAGAMIADQFAQVRRVKDAVYDV